MSSKISKSLTNYLNFNGKYVKLFQANNVLEVCIAKFWSNAGDAQLEASVEFRGIYSNDSRKSNYNMNIFSMNFYCPSSCLNP